MLLDWPITLLKGRGWDMFEGRKETYWGRFAQGYDEGVEYIVGNDIQKTIEQKLSEERKLGRVIELGCGTGYFTKTIAKNAVHVLATDLSDEMLQKARIRLKTYMNVGIQKIDCEDISFPSQRFDTVIAINVLHFIEKPDLCLKESYRILNDDGLLILADYTGYGMTRYNRLKLVSRFLRKCGKPPRYAQANLSPDDFSSSVVDTGFRVEEVQLIGTKTKALYLRGRK
jgi:ABC-2 type transport system ATP-binding protein